MSFTFIKMVSLFRREKLNYVFDTFLDVTKDGSIAQDDFALAVQKIATSRGFTEDDENYIELSEQFLHFWVKLQQAADSDGDGMVSRDEWVELWANSVNDDWKILYMDFMFTLQDTSGDGSIDEKEFIELCSAYGVSPDECKRAYDKMTHRGAISIDFCFYSELWKQYFTSDDVDAVGNCIFGKIFH